MRFLKLITADVVFAALLFGASAVIAGIVKMQNPDCFTCGASVAVRFWFASVFALQPVIWVPGIKMSIRSLIWFVAVAAGSITYLVWMFVAGVAAVEGYTGEALWLGVHGDDLLWFLPLGISGAWVWLLKRQEEEGVTDAVTKFDTGENMTPADRNEDYLNEPRQLDGRGVIPQTDDGTNWAQEFRILFEYDPVVKECHDELADIDPHLSNRFRTEVLSNRKEAREIRDRLKSERDKKIAPYVSAELNAALSEAQLLGVAAEHEFKQVIKVMGEDVDVTAVMRRLMEKFDPVNMANRLKSIVGGGQGNGFHVLKPGGGEYLRRFSSVEEAMEFMREIGHPELDR
jgi:hypothetical protein